MVAAKTDRGVGAGAQPQVRVPRVLRDWGVSPDGNHFLLAVPVRPPSPVDLRMNWDPGPGETGGLSKLSNVGAYATAGAVVLDTASLKNPRYRGQTRLLNCRP
jgi:hypothetical protein